MGLVLIASLDPSWEKRQATPTQRLVLWNCTRNILTENDVLNPLVATPKDAGARTKATRPRFEAMEHVFWVKVSFIVTSLNLCRLTLIPRSFLISWISSLIFHISMASSC